MRKMHRPLTAAAVLLLGLACLLLPADRVRGQTGSSPSSDELDIFRNLSPDQQQAVLGAFGTGGAGGLGSLSTGTNRSSATNRQNEAEQRNQQNGVRRQNEEETGVEEESQIPALKGEDWVIIEIDYRLPPRALSPSMETYFLSRGISPGQVSLGTQQQQGVQPPLALPQGGAQQPQENVPGNGVLSPEAAALGAARASSNTGAPAASGEEETSEDVLTTEQQQRLRKLMTLIRSRNPYRLTRDGALALPGFAPIQLSGLTEAEATLRLKAEPAFSRVDIRLTLLPLKKTGVGALKPFGYDLFDNPASTFAPFTNVPVPANYVVGPGDQLEVQLYGSTNRTLRLPVDREGRISLPEIGPVSVGGLLFNDAKDTVEARVKRQMIGTTASVSMGDTRAIRVFVLGEAKQPGSYTVSGLATITSALYAAGGVKKMGSLRKIQLKRQGRVVRTLDLYDMLIRGDTTDDDKLLPGDVVFIPPVGRTISVDGEVRRPAIYETRNESSVEDVIQLAGGLTPEADRSKVTLTRIDADEHRVVLQVDTASAAGRVQAVSDGDVLQVARLRPTLDSGIQVQGYVFAPGSIAYRNGIRLTDVIHSVDELRPGADIHYILIRRELAPDRRIVVLSADLAAALAAPGSSANVQLMPRDRLTAFDLTSSRDHVIQPLMDELRAQATPDRPTQVVHIDGRVKVPGDYPLEEGMKVSDLIRAGGGLADSAYGNNAELTRYEVINGQTRRTDLIEVNVDAALRGEAAANIAVQAFDSLSIKEVPEWRGQESMTLSGEVRFPGRYSIRRGETLRSVIDRAGGFTQLAFPDGAVFTRVGLQRREQDQLDALATRMQKDLTILAIQSSATSQSGGTGASAALAAGQQLFAQLRNTKAVGRLVLDLNKAMQAAPGSSDDVILRNGDELIIPRYQQEVTVIGEVQNSTSHLYSSRLSRDDYIAMSGGMTRRADGGAIYIVRANGSVFAGRGSRWFSGGTPRVKPGDTIVVPLNAEHLPPLPYWTAITTIIYNLAIAAAAAHSF